MRRLYDLKRAAYGEISGALDRWAELARAAAPYIQQHAPTAWGEMRGAAEAGVADIDELVMLQLAVEYELYVELGSPNTTDRPSLRPPADKCTGFGAPGLAGQNNDEVPGMYLSGSDDVVLSIEGADSDGEVAALVYTHPGWPAYMGMNSNGVIVLWQYIDTGERSRVGVPTNVLIREMVAQPSLNDALSLLEHAPRMIPNNFIVADKTRATNAEVSPSHFSVLSVSKGFLVHTNHVLFDQDMQDHDLRQSPTSVLREKALREMVRVRTAAGGVVKADDLGSMLRTHPVFRDGQNGTDDHTLASMVFDAGAGSLGIWFKGDPEGASRTYRFATRPHGAPPAVYE